MSNKAPGTAAAEMRVTRLVFFAITGFVILFFFAALVIIQFQPPVGADTERYELWKWVAAVLSLFALFLAKRVFYKGSNAAKNSLIPLAGKLRIYRRALLVYLALMELGACVNIVLFILSGHFIFLAFAAVLLGFMLAMNPSLRRVATELGIDSGEENKLR